ncbi:hypothetical protein V9T40_010517 [Parthenolecanium corni]|uniref:Cytochrome P450 n=1 Tax=Parthenolecanium corni TaxID=536013 RepID=A0AAN9XX94_9HEMI
MWALLELALLVAMAIAVKVKFHRSRVRQMVDRFDGPPAWPFLGNVLMFLGSPTGDKKVATARPGRRPVSLLAINCRRYEHIIGHTLAFGSKNFYSGRPETVFSIFPMRVTSSSEWPRENKKREEEEEEEDMLKNLYSWQKKSRGEAFRLWLLHKPIVAVTALEDIRIVSKVPQKDQVYEYLTSILGDGLITTNGRKWKRSRRLLDPMFNTAAVGVNFLEIFNRQNTMLADEVQRNQTEGVPFDVWPYIFRMSLQTIYGKRRGADGLGPLAPQRYIFTIRRTLRIETAVGSQIRVHDEILDKLQDGILKACHLSFKRCYQPWLRPTLVFRAYLHAKGYGNVFDDVRQFHRQMIADKKKIFNDARGTPVAENTAEKKSVLDAMLAGQQAAEELSDEDIANEIVTLLFAGTETSSVIICFTLMMLASHPDLQRKAYEEIREKTPDDPSAHLSLKHLSELTFLEKCIKETMRKFSIVPLLLRQSPEDVTLKSGLVIPAGVTIAVSPYAVHHDPAYYENPRQWNPSNFDADKVAARPAFTFIPFGTGQRTCLGNKYGMTSMKISLVALLRRFELSTTQTRFELDQTFMTRCANGYHLRIRRRQRSAQVQVAS